MMGIAALRILDPCAPRAYARLASLHRLGGTESTVLRIASGLSRDMDVSVEQAARRTAEIAGTVRFRPMDPAAASPATILVINAWDVALACHRHNPRARILVWQHLVPAAQERPALRRLADAGIEIVCVSDWLAAEIRALAGAAGPSIAVIANPIADDLHPDATPRDPDLLFFASSPKKGLDQVLAAFETLRGAIRGLRLEVADPGYLSWQHGTMPAGVCLLGTLPHPAVIAKMRAALCVFYPQTGFAETFGLVIAEANAVGCPVLVHRGLGANDEVASDARQCLDCTDARMIAARIRDWRRATPAVSLDPRFRLSAVLRRWRGHLGVRCDAAGGARGAMCDVS